jgi:hypothetical protein
MRSYGRYLCRAFGPIPQDQSSKSGLSLFCILQRSGHQVTLFARGDFIDSANWCLALSVRAGGTYEAIADYQVKAEASKMRQKAKPIIRQHFSVIYKRNRSVEYSRRRALEAFASSGCLITELMKVYSERLAPSQPRRADKHPAASVMHERWDGLSYFQWRFILGGSKKVVGPPGRLSFRKDLSAERLSPISTTRPAS